MDIESSVCNSCRIKTGCHRRLKPEETLYNPETGLNEVTSLEDGYAIACRHYSCRFGKGAASIAASSLQADTQDLRARVVYGSGGSDVQQVASFGTVGKPEFIHFNTPYGVLSIISRIVNSAGRIFSRRSWDDPKYYDTGVYAREPRHE